ncbi:MAG: SMC-Scp complex subunit ScpB [Asgard group archaeon]|nr:SMC-Scp complex subunit ScpB [Asgard group archaeon]
MDEHGPLSEEAERLQFIEKRQAVEAALYLAGRPVRHEDLAQVVGIDTAELGSIIRDLQEKYRQTFSCFEIVELPGKKYVFQIRASIGEKVKEITLQPILTLAELRTLAMIAYRQPILQSTVAKVRGQQAYSHIKTLLRNGFVKATKMQQTLELKTTQLFSDYFGLSDDKGVLKRQLGWRTKRLIKKKKQTKLKERDSKSIEDFMKKIGLNEEDINKESLQEIEEKIKMDKDSARDLFPGMLDDLDESEGKEKREKK